MTGLDANWGDGEEELLFLGEWCKFQNSSARDAIDSVTLPYHWQDRAKLEADYKYLQEFYERLLALLGRKLNSHHNLDFPLPFWRIILGPWLLSYVAVIWDRFECVRLALQNFDIDRIVSFEEEIDCYPREYQHAITLFFDHAFNQSLITKIIEDSHKNIMISKAVGFSERSPIYRRVENSLIRKVAFIFDKILAVIPNRVDTLLYKHYFPVSTHINLSFKVCEVPRMFHEFEREAQLPVANQALRNGIVTNDPFSSDFEKFAWSNIFKYIPISYLEGFSTLLDMAKQIKYKPRLVFTANAHISNELFKIWTALACGSNGSKLIVSDHGGAFHSRLNLMDHEELISHKKVVWGLARRHNHVRLPSQKTLRKGYRLLGGGQFCTIVGQEFPVYSYRCRSGPNSSLVLEDFQQKINFIDFISSDVYHKLKIRPYPNQGWNLGERYIELYGSEKIDRSSSLIACYAKAKVIICGYPQTIFFQALSSGKPTILLYTEKYWELEMIYNELISEMKDASMIFACPDKAAEHINHIWGDPLKWWNEPKTVRAREHFFDVCGGRTPGNAVDLWANFFKVLAKKAL